MGMQLASNQFLCEFESRCPLQFDVGTELKLCVQFPALHPMVIECKPVSSVIVIHVLASSSLVNHPNPGRPSGEAQS